MKPGARIEVDGSVLEFVRYPEYKFAHPGEQYGDGVCDRCAIAKRLDTGEEVLLWLCGGVNWSVSRNEPEYERHKEELRC